MENMAAHLYLGIPAGLALLVVPTVLLESQWRLFANRRKASGKEAKALSEPLGENRAA